MKKLLLIFLLALASCGEPCSCEYLNNDPFNSSTMPNGCGCSAGKIYVPDMAADSEVDAGNEVKSTIDIQSKHKVK
tara:strand:+ start:471 stop:698 length:228 start_codon:yes stop_codon:yes gene_type:complete